MINFKKYYINGSLRFLGFNLYAKWNSLMYKLYKFTKEENNKTIK